MNVKWHRELWHLVSGSCPMPNGYCTHAGATFSLEDCDGDGIIDPVCRDTDGNIGVIQSSKGCFNTWPSGTCHSK